VVFAHFGKRHIMPDLATSLRFVRDNITLLVFVVLLTSVGGAWIVFEALRSHKNREEVKDSEED